MSDELNLEQRAMRHADKTIELRKKAWLAISGTS